MQPQLSDPDWLAKCNSIIGRELSRRGWTLADDPSLFGPGQSFTANVLARITEWVTQETRPLDDKLISDAVKNEYSRLLETAIGLDGSRVQNTALSEAMRYAWPHALQRCSGHEQAETAVLRAATQAWLHIDRCYPGCFLAWFTSIIIHETANLDKQERRLAGRETSETDLSADPSHGSDADFESARCGRTPLRLLRSLGRHRCRTTRPLPHCFDRHVERVPGKRSPRIHPYRRILPRTQCQRNRAPSGGQGWRYLHGEEPRTQKNPRALSASSSQSCN